MENILIVKIGGSLLRKDLTLLFADLKQITRTSKVILVHGWSYEVNTLYQRLGIKTSFYTSAQGFVSRKTDKKAIECILMATGVINKSLVQQLSKNNVSSFGLSGVDGKILQAEKKSFRIREDNTLKAVKEDQTGKITFVDTGALLRLLEPYDCLVVTPLAVGENQEILSTDADRAAAQIAIALKSQSLVYLSNVDGYQEAEKTIRMIDKDCLKEAIHKAEKGMKKKLWAAKEALEENVAKIMIGDGTKSMPVTRILGGEMGSLISTVIPVLKECA